MNKRINKFNLKTETDGKLNSMIFLLIWQNMRFKNICQVFHTGSWWVTNLILYLSFLTVLLACPHHLLALHPTFNDLFLPSLRTAGDSELSSKQNATTCRQCGG